MRSAGCTGLLAGFVLLICASVAEAEGASRDAPPAELRRAIPALANSTQALLVTVPGWDSVSANCQRFERVGRRENWRKTGSEFEVSIGRNGLAWGIGLHGTHPDKGPVKREGDGRSPAGVFWLSAAFGYAPATAANLSAFPYLELTPTTEGVDDSWSRYYNRVVDAKEVKDKDWTSSEQMLRKDDLYRWGVIVAHNEQPFPGYGSCIFLHVWSAAGHGTAGCTAMPLAKMELITRWLNKVQEPVLIQLPTEEYLRHKREWRLP